MTNEQTILVTGGAGFIGSALIRYIIANTKHKVVNIDKLSYSGNLGSLNSIKGNKNYIFERVDISDDTTGTAPFGVNDKIGSLRIRGIDPGEPGSNTPP